MNKEAQQLVQQLQMQNQQLQQLEMQEQRLQLQKTEIENALEELDKIEHNDVYQATGSLLIKSNKKKAKKELKEQKQEVDARLKSVGNQKQKLEKKLKQGQEKVRQFLPQQK